MYQAIASKIKIENVEPAVKEVLHYREALWAGYTDLKKKDAFDMKSITSIYQQVKSTSEGIRSPHSQVVIRRGNSDLKPGEIVYTPPRGGAIFSQPYIKPSIIGNITGRKSRTTLTAYMQELTRKKILSANQVGKEVFYINNDLVRILES